MSLSVADDDGVQALDINQIANALLGYSVRTGVGSGCSVSTTSGMSVDIGDGEVTFGGVVVNVQDQQVTLDTGTANPRKDVIYVDTNGIATIAKGNAESAVPNGEIRESTYRPAPPDLEGTDAVVLAEIWVGSNVTSLNSADIRDRRIDVDPSSLPSKSLYPQRIVYKDSSASRWVSLGETDIATFVDPASALNHAANNASRVHLRDSVPSNDPITSTVDLGGSDLIGPGVRGTATIYVDTDQANPGIRNIGGAKIKGFFIRGDADTVSGTFSSGDALWLQDMGRGSVVEDISVFGTTGHGMVVSGCQQMTFRNTSFSRTGDVGNDKWCVYLTNSPTDGLETNAINWFGLHNHGSAPQGGLIAMRADQHSDTDRPRTINFSGMNVENGPQSGNVPLIEVSGRDHLFRGNRLAGLDTIESIFKVVGGRARNVRIADTYVISGTGDFWDANGVGTATPTINDCYVDVPGSLILDFYNQTFQPLRITNAIFLNNSNPSIKVIASKNGGLPVMLSNVYSEGTIDIQGAELALSNVISNGGFAGNSNGFGPQIITDDGSFKKAYNVVIPGHSNTNANASGLFFWDFLTEFQIAEEASVHVEFVDTPGDGVYMIDDVGLLDTNSDGYYDRAKCIVRDSAGNGVDGTTGNWSVRIDVMVGKA